MIRSGFFNSDNNDRLYDAEDMGKIFEGVISDGVFHNIGDRLKAEKISGSMNINILSGKAWFYNKYFEVVDKELINISYGTNEPRIDRLYLEIDNSRSGRRCKFNLQQGIPSSTPLPRVLSNTDDKKYIQLYDFYIPANANTNENVIITSNIGNISCPWATTTLDPKRGLYLYDSDSSEDIYLNEIKTGFIKLNTNSSGGGSTTITYDTPFSEDKEVIIMTQLVGGSSAAGSFYCDRIIVQPGVDNGRLGFELDIKTDGQHNDVGVRWMAIGISI